jgi:hypothetical protein
LGARGLCEGLYSGFEKCVARLSWVSDDEGSVVGCASSFFIFLRCRLSKTPACLNLEGAEKFLGAAASSTFTLRYTCDCINTLV